MEIKNKKIWHWVVLLAILGAALFIRAYNIEKIPAGIYPDEAVNAIDAMTANATSHYQLFYPNNNGREGLFMNLIALSFKIFGETIFALRSWSIILGVLTVLGMYLLSKELFRSQRAGLISAFLYAFCYWALNFSRISFRANMLPFVFTFSFYFLLKGLRTKKYYAFILAGAFFGLGLHTYIAFRVAPLILVIFLAGLIIAKKGFLKEYWKEVLVFVLFITIVSAPMLYDFWKNPDHFSSRSASISILSPSVNHGHLITTFLKSFGLSLAKYTFYGDQNWRHNFPPYSLLDPITGLFFLLGFIYLIGKTIHLLVQRFRENLYDDKLYIYILLVAWFFVMLIPEFMTSEGVPHALRSIGTLPVAIIIATLPFLFILGRAEKYSFLTRKAVYSLFVFIFIFIGLFNPIKYFFFWAARPEAHANFNENFKNMASYLVNLPPNVNKYVVANAGGTTIEDGLPVTAEPIKFLTDGKIENMKFLMTGTNEVLKSPMVFVIMDYNQQIVEKILSLFPQAQVKKIDLDPGSWSDFTIIEVK